VPAACNMWQGLGVYGKCLIFPTSTFIGSVWEDDDQC